MQKYLTASGELTKWENADISKDGQINVFDLIILKRMLLS